MAVGIRPETRSPGRRARGRPRHRRRRRHAHLGPDILAVGECVEHGGTVLRPGRAALGDVRRSRRRRSLGEPAAYAAGHSRPSSRSPASTCSPPATSPGATDREDIVFRDAGRGVYKRVVLSDEKHRRRGAVRRYRRRQLVLRPAQGRRGRRRDDPRHPDLRPGLRRGRRRWTLTPPLQPCRTRPRSAAATASARARSPRRSPTRGLTTLDEVRAVTKASASCGSCTGLVEQLLALTLGDDFVMPTAKPVCKCTDLTHDDVRRLIMSKELKSIPRSCRSWTGRRPAAASSAARRSTTTCSAPGRANTRTTPSRRFVNERVHANIQKDGTYSVVPRMWGGVTTPARAARHRRRGREVQRADGQGHRRPAHRPLRRQEGGPAGGLGRPQRRRHGLGPRLRQGPAHGEDLRRLRMVPLRHPGLDRARRQARADDLGLLDAAQGQDRRLRLPAQLRRGDHQGLRRGLRRLAATRSTSAATAASRSGRPSSSPRSRPRRRRSRSPPPSSSSTASRPSTSSGPTVGRAGRARLGQGAGRRRPRDRAALAARFDYCQTFYQNDPWAKRAAGRRARTSSRRSPTCACRRPAESNAMTGRPGSTSAPSTTSRCAARRVVTTPARLHRGVPHRRRRGLRAGRPLPAQGRPAQPGHRPRPRGHLPAAQLDHRAGDRRGARAPTRAACRTPASGSRPAASCSTPAALRGHDRWRGPHHLPLLRRRLRRHRHPRRRAQRRDRRRPRAPGQLRPALLEGRRARRDRRPRRPAARTPHRRPRRRLGRGARPRRRDGSATPSTRHGRTASRSTSPASC